MIKKVLVGISGGVDSAVTAFLLKQQDYEVTAAFLYMHNLSSDAQNDAMQVAKDLNIEFVVIDASKEFKDIVIENFVNTYQNGCTPNPCIICNPNIKFKLLYDYAEKNHIDYIATGHYAKINFENNRYFIQKLEDKKDQSYMLYRLTQLELSKLMLPLCDYKKEKVREIAKKNNIKVCSKADSQDICFIKGSYTDYIIKYQNKFPVCGDFILSDTNEKIGKHKGIIYYTIGQRKGLGISHSSPLFVEKIDVKENNIYLSTKLESLVDTMQLNDVVFQKIPKVDNKISAFVKIRYSQQATKAIIYYKNNNYKVEFLEHTKSITPGQSAVFYDEKGDILFGGIILLNS